MAQDQLLLSDGVSNLLLSDGASVLLLSTGGTTPTPDPDSNPFRATYQLDNRATYRLDARRNYRRHR